MNATNAVSFLATAGTDSELARKLVEVQTATGQFLAEKLAGIATASGYSLSAEDFLDAASESSAELTEEQLDAVPGGVVTRALLWFPAAIVGLVAGFFGGGGSQGLRSKRLETCSKRMAI